jgi:hypothetical protein
MSELSKVNISEMFDAQFPSAEDRLSQAYQDPIVQQRFADIMLASADERPALQAQLTTYLAAAYYLFPQESQIIHDSLNEGEAYE